MPRRRNTPVTPENTQDEQALREPVPMAESTPAVREEPSQAQEQRQEDQAVMEPAPTGEQVLSNPEESMQLQEEQAAPAESPQLQEEQAAPEQSPQPQAEQDMEESAPAMQERQEPVAAPQIPLSVKISSLELDGNTRAFATAEYGDLTIRRVRVKEDGQGRLFVAMPKFRQTTGYTETCFFNSPDAVARFQSAVLDTYQQTLEQMRGQTREQVREHEQEESPVFDDPDPELNPEPDPEQGMEMDMSMGM